MTTPPPLPPRDAVLTAVLDWLYRTRQPATAILNRYGIELPYEHDTPRVLRVLAAGYTGYPFLILASRIQAERIDQDEIQAAAGELKTAGGQVTEIYPGVHGNQITFALGKKAHPTLTAAQDRYRHGCTKHQTPGLLCNCGWREEGARHVIMPAAPGTPEKESDR